MTGHWFFLRLNFGKIFLLVFVCALARKQWIEGKCLALLGANASRSETTRSVIKTSQIRAELFNVGPGNDGQNQPSFSIAVAFLGNQSLTKVKPFFRLICRWFWCKSNVNFIHLVWVDFENCGVQNEIRVFKIKLFKITDNFKHARHHN